jgi:hypothetical protein
MSRFPSAYYKLSWQEITSASGSPLRRSGPGRKTQLLGERSFPPSCRADLMMAAEQLLDQGYRISISPPSGPPLEALDVPAEHQCVPVTVVDLRAA